MAFVEPEANFERGNFPFGFGSDRIQESKDTEDEKL